jgi:hypothetical protein
MSESLHLRLSLALIAAFLAAGLVLESMIGLRMEGAVSDSIQREFLRLGHAHGGILGLVNLGIGAAAVRLKIAERWAKPSRVAAWLGAACVGAGFMLAGWFHGPADPGPAILVVPAGAFMMLGALLVMAIAPKD